MQLRPESLISDDAVRMFSEGATQPNKTTEEQVVSEKVCTSDALLASSCLLLQTARSIHAQPPVYAASRVVQVELAYLANELAGSGKNGTKPEGASGKGGSSFLQTSSRVRVSARARARAHLSSTSRDKPTKSIGPLMPVST